MPTTIENLYWPIAPGSSGTSSVGLQILENFKRSKEYRHAFVEEKVRTFIAAQIKAIREQRGMSRPDFARSMGKAPSWVFRLEDPNASPPTISTLLRVAEAYDVNLEIKFSPFSSLIDELDHVTPDLFEVPSFDEEIAHSGLTHDVEQDAIMGGRLFVMTAQTTGAVVATVPHEQALAPKMPAAQESIFRLPGFKTEQTRYGNG